MSDFPPGLYVVATPIGNLGDLSPRAISALAGAYVIAAEDTRHSARLLAHAGVQTPMRSLHEHNEHAVVPELIGRLIAGETVALISDAGTPLVSDPGFVLVRAAREAGLPVYAIPGACAAIAALSVSGLPSDRFVFEGFLPPKATGRRKRLAELADETRTLVLYESSHRIERAVRDIAEVLGDDRRMALARELTKLHEDTVVDTAASLLDWLAADDNRRRGEFVLVLSGAPDSQPDAEATVSLQALMTELAPAMGLRDAAKAAARLLGVSRNEAYQAGLTVSGSAGS